MGRPHISGRLGFAGSDFVMCIAADRSGEDMFTRVEAARAHHRLRTAEVGVGGAAGVLGHTPVSRLLVG